jgi:hypothetical protein
MNGVNQRRSGQNAGLCEHCRFKRLITSDRGSVFYMCEKSATDASFPKYPRLPVRQCRGYEPAEATAHPNPMSS